MRSKLAGGEGQTFLVRRDAQPAVQGGHRRGQVATDHPHVAGAKQRRDDASAADVQRICETAVGVVEPVEQPVGGIA